MNRNKHFMFKKYKVFKVLCNNSSELCFSSYIFVKNIYTYMYNF